MDKEWEESYEKKGSSTLKERRDIDMGKILQEEVLLQKGNTPAMLVVCSFNSSFTLLFFHFVKEKIHFKRFSKGFGASGLNFIIISLL